MSVAGRIVCIVSDYFLTNRLFFLNTMIHRGPDGRGLRADCGVFARGGRCPSVHTATMQNKTSRLPPAVVFIVRPSLCGGAPCEKIRQTLPHLQRLNFPSPAVHRRNLQNTNEDHRATGRRSPVRGRGGMAKPLRSAAATAEGYARRVRYRT